LIKISNKRKMQREREEKEEVRKKKENREARDIVVELQCISKEKEDA
jgi:hypothetical protein